MALNVSAVTITMTNGPGAPNGRLYLGNGRTNVLLCQVQLDTDTQTFGNEAWGIINIRGHTKRANEDYAISNVRCVDSFGNIFDYPHVTGGGGSSDGKEFTKALPFHQYLGYGAFTPQPGAPVTISIIADLGPGYQSGDVLETSIEVIYNIISEGNYWSPTGTASSSVTMLTDASRITSIVKTAPAQLQLKALGKPNASYNVEAANSIGGSWQKITPTPIGSTASGDITFDYDMVPGEDVKFFRLDY